MDSTRQARGTHRPTIESFLYVVHEIIAFVRCVAPAYTRRRAPLTRGAPCTDHRPNGADPSETLMTRPHRSTPHPAHPPNALTRRDLLSGLALSGAAVAAATLLPGGTALAATLPDPASDLPAPDTPAAALRALVDGNRRFADGRATGPNRTLSRVRNVAPQQAPFAAVLSCADSRVPVEIVFDQGFGDVFVCRAAGNVVTPELLASLEFGTLVLGAKVLMVLGHTSCGAVKATLDGAPVPGQISTLYQRIQPAVEAVTAAGTVELEAITRENVRLQVRLLARSSPVVAGLVREGKLVVAGGVYDLASGRVTMVDV